ncbi:MAG TPA: GTPase Era [Clostridia bacterium]|nr:GTPase Era [Clostridia bacterium]
MMIDLNHYNRQRVFPLRGIEPLVREAATHALFSAPFIQRLMADGIRISVDWTLIGPRSMRKLNRDQRGVDMETDILSFPAREMLKGEPVAPIPLWEMAEEEGTPKRLFLGDLVIAPAVVAKQAESLGHSFEKEVTFLVTHGILHLLGYDHVNQEDELEMVALQKRLVADLLETPCGFVALTGRANVGKSTLLNELSDRTLAITSAKPQTTRHVIRSVLTTDDYQMAFLDMPGLHKPKTTLGKSMMKAASGAISRADVVALMIDASWHPFVGELERHAIEQAKRANKPVVLIINKIDGSPKENILPLIKAYDDLYQLDAYVPISARDGDGLNHLIDEIRRLLPVRRRLFDLDDETDQTERVLTAELVRREILTQTDKEVPYGVTVIIERFEEQESRDDPKNGSNATRRVEIDAVIVCSRSSHKQILLGKGGSKIKSIGISARESIEWLLDARIFLSLFVKVKPDWQNRPQDLKQAGLFEEE